MVYGTPYFPTLEDAIKYYVVQGFTPYQVHIKLCLNQFSPEIYIGKPPGLHSRRRAVLHKDQGGSQRYFIHEDIRIG